MKFKKPNFLYYKEPNLFAYILLPFTYVIKLINFISKKIMFKKRINNTSLIKIVVLKTVI